MAAAERELEDAAQALARREPAESRYAAALERFLALGGGDFEARARATCAELGLAVELDRPASVLSGGEAARAALASILLSRFDLLLLDEPTNDLDFDGLDRLERFLDGVRGRARRRVPRPRVPRPDGHAHRLDRARDGTHPRVGGRVQRLRAAAERGAGRRLRALRGGRGAAAHARGAAQPAADGSAREGRLAREGDRRRRPAGDACALDEGAPGRAPARAGTSCRRSRSSPGSSGSRSAARSARATAC